MNILASFIPYLAVWVGMILFRSAWLALGLYHAGIIAFLWYRRPIELPTRIRSGFGLPLLIPTAAACALAAPIIYVLWPWLNRPEVPLRTWLNSYGLSGTAWTLFIPYFSIIHPILEEAHWRTLTDKPDRLLCWRDAAFAGYHLLVLGTLVRLPWLSLVFSALVIASSFWRWTAQRFGGYGLSIATHAIADAAVLGGALWVLNNAVN